jgi:molecular chaperone DnaK
MVVHSGVSWKELVWGTWSIKRDTHLGGKDFVIIPVEHFINSFKKQTGISLSKDQIAI